MFALCRCLKEEISTIRGEIRERKDRAEKLKIKYDLIVKSLGCEGGPTDSGQRAEKATTDLPSHAFQVQSTAMTKSQADIKIILLLISVGEIGPGKGRAPRPKRNYGEKAEKRGRGAARA